MPARSFMLLSYITIPILSPASLLLTDTQASPPKQAPDLHEANQKLKEPDREPQSRQISHFCNFYGY